ncbi:unnamed protein product (macronuclear) [Paramecium tetraurelia]|uniref:Transmembrane protein n=1 Tax=Paramecium tetraurelia TaxID=5888 RepID=A0C8Y9_PARTE|nr:uncharacterized protein GSPATT00036392001 [Paramecium tetraurelia]CAK67256.1 unnamed protein product [Paramecium tetraurelia]|eukprot:XP_001434653.1 hypothetical protein (macronuclear) [Paramecium tetraurelia strain d4-2]
MLFSQGESFLTYSVKSTPSIKLEMVERSIQGKKIIISSSYYQCYHQLFSFEFIFNCTLITLILIPQLMQHFHQIPEIKYLIQKDNLFSSNSTSNYKKHSIFVSAQIKNKKSQNCNKIKIHSIFWWLVKEDKFIQTYNLHFQVNISLFIFNSTTQQLNSFKLNFNDNTIVLPLFESPIHFITLCNFHGFFQESISKVQGSKFFQSHL